MFDHFVDSRYVTLLYPLLGWAAALALARFTTLSRASLRRYVVTIALCFVLWAISAWPWLASSWSAGFSLAAACLFVLASLRLTLLATFETVARSLGLHGHRIYADIATFVIGVAVAAVALARLGIESTSLFTGSAIATALLALSLKETVGNMLAGVAIRVQQPFDVGDWIQYDDKREHIGQVQEINWRATTIRTLDAVHIVVPNAKIAENPISNFSSPVAETRRSVFFTCPYHVSPARVHELVMRSLHDADGLCKSPPPSIVTYGFTERGVEYWLRYFIREMGRRDGIDGGVRDRVWFALSSAEIAFSPATSELLISKTRPQPIDSSKPRLARDLSHSLLFKNVSPAAAELLARGARLRTALPGEVIVREGDDGHELFVVASGTLSVSKTIDGREVPLAVLRAGDCFGERSLLLGEPRSATVTATHNCELIALQKSDVRDTFTEHPEVMEAISEMLAARELEAKDRITDSLNVATAAEPKLLNRIRRFLAIS